jgi:hypothetical protein
LCYKRFGERFPPGLVGVCGSSDATVSVFVVSDTAAVDVVVVGVCGGGVDAVVAVVVVVAAGVVVVAAEGVFAAASPPPRTGVFILRCRTISPMIFSSVATRFCALRDVLALPGMNQQMLL